MAKAKNWKQDKINQMLSNRELFEKEYNLVSHLLLLISLFV
jgi:hypothetical protein